MKNAAGNPRKSSVLNVVLTMMLILFVSLLAFCSGLYLGKQLTDSEYQLKALEGDFSKASKTAKHDSGHKDDEHKTPSDVINDEDIDAMSEKFVTNEKAEENEPAHQREERTIASAHGNTHGHDDEHDAHTAAPAKAAHDDHAAPAKKSVHDEHAAPAKKQAANTHGDDHAAPAKAAQDNHAAPAKEAHGKAKPDLSAVHKAAARVAQNAAPSEETHEAHETNRVPTSLPKTVGVSADVEFTVQVASYPTMEAAKAKSEELEQKGFVSFPVPAQVNGKTWYRVSVGSFKTHKDATAYRAKFLQKTGLSTAIVQKIQR